MPDSPRPPAAPLHPWVMRAGIVGIAAAVATATAAIEAASSPSAAGRTVTHRGTQLDADAASVGGSDAASDGGDVDGGRPQGADGVPVRRATMSMDAPIQGGLTAHQAQAIAAAVLSRHQDAATAAQSATWTAAMGRTAAARARSWLGMPYSWAGGNAAGPTPGVCDTSNGADLDCHITGFDCSGLSLYSWAPYVAMDHLAERQRSVGQFHPTVAQLLPGDLVFFSAYLPNGIGHVAIYVGDGMVIEAPESGAVVRLARLTDLIATDGTYRGATRPLSGATPVLTTPRTATSTKGGTLTLRGTHLASVTAVRVGSTVVRDIVRRTDTSLTLRVPAHEKGSVPVQAVASWGAASRAVALSYAAPHHATAASPTATPTTLPTSTSPSPSPSPTRGGSPTTLPTPSPSPSRSASPSGSGSSRSSTSPSPSPTSGDLRTLLPSASAGN